MSALLFDLPEDKALGTPHTWKHRPAWVDKPKPHEPIFLEGRFAEQAACGRGVRMVFPVPFDLAWSPCPARPASAQNRTSPLRAAASMPLRSNGPTTSG